MSTTSQTREVWAPLEASERYAVLDLVRGFALFGVLLVNLLYFFRVPLLEHMQHPHSHPGRINYAIDWFVAEFIEFRAFGLFSLSFGIGVAVQVERARERGVVADVFLARRFLILLAIGACHMVLVSNVDILMLYALCGLVMIPLLRLAAPLLLLAGIACIWLPSVFSGWPPMLPPPDWSESIANARRIYGFGSFGAILEFRWRETRQVILPLLANVAQWSLGLMLIGAAAWRAGVIRDPLRYRNVLMAVLLAGMAAGFFWGQFVLVVFAYAAGILLWRPKFVPVAAAGQMALTNYLTQSVLLSLLFYGYGFGLFGRIDPLTGTVIAIVLYAAQLWASAWWLRRYRFGPCEWAWRSLTYRRLQPMSLPRARV